MKTIVEYMSLLTEPCCEYMETYPQVPEAPALFKEAAYLP